MPKFYCPECGKEMEYISNNQKVQCPICKTWDFVSRLLRWAKI